jgi:hypothetical protein
LSTRAANHNETGAGWKSEGELLLANLHPAAHI